MGWNTCNQFDCDTIYITVDGNEKTPYTSLKPGDEIWIYENPAIPAANVTIQKSDGRLAFYYFVDGKLVDSKTTESAR